VVATPWDQALANRVPLDLGAVAEATLDAKLALAEVVLRGVDRANRRRLGLPEETGHTGDGQRGLDEPPRWHSQPLPPNAGQAAPMAPDIPAQPAAVSPAVSRDALGGEPYARIIPAGPTPEQRTD
jgi:hypothetical protein